MKLIRSISIFLKKLQYSILRFTVEYLISASTVIVIITEINLANIKLAKSFSINLIILDLIFATCIKNKITCA